MVPALWFEIWFGKLHIIVQIRCGRREREGGGLTQGPTDSQFLNCARVLTCDDVLAPGQGAGLRPDVRHGAEVTRCLVWERYSERERRLVLIIFLINILIMLCARWVLWMQHWPSARLCPLPLWMMDQLGPSQDRVCSPPLPSQGLAPPLPGGQYKLPSPYTFHWIKYSESYFFLSLGGIFWWSWLFLCGLS